MKKILIGVQARSGSTRLKGKCSMGLGDSTLAGQVMTQGLRAAGWMNGLADFSVVMLIPFGDPLGNRTFVNDYETFEGPEDDVLTRYYQAMVKYDADYVVRLTGDCAWMTSYMITKCVRGCLKFDADYCSNILVRTFMEGLDVEVISARMMIALQDMVGKDSEHREHVTSAIPDFLKSGLLGSFKFHTILSEYDYSDIKTSIDTAEEYEKCNMIFEKRRQKKAEAHRFGSTST
jgi:spore coat polysaccharide biosynthesis protein SpsF